MSLAAKYDNLSDLEARLSPCRACECVTARIKGEELRCESCGRSRGRLTQTTIKFLETFIKTFGRPTAPINLTHNPKPFLPPHGAAAETVIARAENR